MREIEPQRGAQSHKGFAQTGSFHSRQRAGVCAMHVLWSLGYQESYEGHVGLLTRCMPFPLCQASNSPFPSPQGSGAEDSRQTRHPGRDHLLWGLSLILWGWRLLKERIQKYKCKLRLGDLEGLQLRFVSLKVTEPVAAALSSKGHHLSVPSL